MKETKMTELLGLRKGEGRTVFYLMSYLTLQSFGTSLGIAIGTSMLLAQVGADKLPYIFVGISFAALCFSSIYPVLMARRGSQYICRLNMIIGFLVILIFNFMISADLYFAGINPGIFLQYPAVLLGWDIMHLAIIVKQFLIQHMVGFMALFYLQQNLGEFRRYPPGSDSIMVKLTF